MMKKTVAVLAAAAMLTVPFAASAGTNSNVNVSATVKPVPQTNLTVNFDGLGFVGTIGDTAVTPRYTKNGTTATNTVDLTARGHYTLLVSASNIQTVMDPMSPTPDHYMLDSRRLQVASPITGTFYPLTGMPTIVDEGTGDIIKTQKALTFKLDLSQPTWSNNNGMPSENYTDGPEWNRLSMSNKETNLFSNVTLSITSM